MIGQKSDAGHISTTNLTGCECGLLVEITLTHYASESSLSIIYYIVMTMQQWEYHYCLPSNVFVLQVIHMK